MLPVSALRYHFVRAVNTHGANQLQHKALRRAFNRQPFTVASELIVLGFHPDTVARHWRDNIVRALPEKLYLLPPNSVPFTELLLALGKLSNVQLYAHHVQFYQRRLLCCGDADIVATCAPYMTLLDDDVRYILDAFGADDAARILSMVNADSMYSMSHCFDERVAEEILLRNPEMSRCLYEHQRFEREFLLNMFSRHGIVPCNEGINDKLTPHMAIDILSGVKNAREAARFLYGLPRRILDSVLLRNFALESIMNGNNLSHYTWYAHTFLADRVNAMHVYACIFFPAVTVDLVGHVMTRERLVNICEFIGRYEGQIEHVTMALVKGQHFDLLARIIGKVPMHMLTEDIVLRAIRESREPVRVCHLRVRSRCVISQCVEKGYFDIIDFLDVASVDVLLEYGANLFTDYCFTTDWFNIDASLLQLFVRRFGFCGPMMRRLLFGYPLSLEATMIVLDYMVDNESNIEMFFPSLASDFRFTVCTMRSMCARTIRTSVTLEYADAQPGLETHTFAHELCHEMGTTLQAYSLTQLRACSVHSMSLVRGSPGRCVTLQFTRATSSWPSVSERLCAQLYDICVFYRHGLLYPYFDHLPHWTPVLDVAEGRALEAPTRFDSDCIKEIDVSRLVRLEDVGGFVTTAMRLQETASNHHAALNTLAIALMVYLVVGSVCLDSDEDLVPFVKALVASSLGGLKFNGILSELSTEACAELAEIRASSRARSGSILVRSSDAARHVLGLCMDLCVAAVISNN